MITIGDRVLYRYSPAGLPVYGVVADVFHGVAAVRVNIENPKTTSFTKSLTLYRKVESWQLLSDNSPLHKHFTTIVNPHNFRERFGVVATRHRHSVTPVMLEKLMDMSRV